MIKAIFKFTNLTLPKTTNPLALHPTAHLPFGSRILYRFASEESVGNVEGQSNMELQGQNRASSFYRNSIRRININDKGKGKFTEHHLLRLIKLTQKVHQEPLLFEAYYNYLGHFTPIRSTTVDKMLLKSLSFEGSSIDKIIELLQNHNYLSYFPHYEVTKQVTQLARTNQQHYNRLLNIFYNSPLIKFDAPIVNILLQDLTNPTLSNTTFGIIQKLLIQRSHYGLLEDIIKKRELLSKVVQAIEKRVDSSTFKICGKSTIVSDWVSQTLTSETLDDNTHFQLAILGISNKQQTIFGDNLIMVKDEPKLIRCLLYLQLCPESFQKAAVKYLNTLQLSEQLRVRLQEFKPTSSEPASVQSQ